jgi:hypothetical protein
MIIVLCLDVAMVAGAIALGLLFIAFKAGKAVYDTIDKLIEAAITTAFRLAEDALESPPLDKIPIFQLVLVGIKKAYDLINGAQKLIEAAINLFVTAVAAILVLLCGLALAAINMAALGAVIYYLA